MTDTDNEVREALRRAGSLANEAEDEYRPIAFKVLLERFLGAGASSPGNSTEALASYQDGSRKTKLPPSMGLSEFLVTKNVQSHVDRVMAIAYFTYQQPDGGGITTRDIAGAYGKARQRKPQNIPDVLATCVRRGLLIDAEPKDGMKAWVITQTGEGHVNAL